MFSQGLISALAAVLVLLPARNMFSALGDPGYATACGNAIASTNVRYDSWEWCHQRPELGGCYAPDGDYDKTCGWKVKGTEWTCGIDTSPHGGQGCWPGTPTTTTVTDIWNECYSAAGTCTCDHSDPYANTAPQGTTPVTPLTTGPTSLCPVW
jgi:hypothetical protein